MVDFLDISSWELLSKRTYSINRYSPDGTWVAKVFLGNDASTIDDLIEQQALSEHIVALGVSTPKPGGVYETPEGPALLYQRIHNKRSLGRAISQEPNRLEELTVQFARELKTLHQTPCDTEFFPSHKANLLEWTKSSPSVADKDREFLYEHFSKLDDTQTCLMIDAHPGNLITGDEGTFFIDLGMFSWGSPLYDLADFYNVCHFMDENATIELIHLDRKMLLACWEVFCSEYFGIDTASGRETLIETLVPYEIAVPLWVEQIAGCQPWMKDAIAMRIEHLRAIK